MGLVKWGSRTSLRRVGPSRYRTGGLGCPANIQRLETGGRLSSTHIAPFWYQEPLEDMWVVKTGNASQLEDCTVMANSTVF
ncbi:jg21225 [Pararge aegeria aegeria]|uniref:Jg21225 protein n=1 Tax=Pararge aegeria aegeria TaxID=348720 RepID=A0A8S4RA80_9NEOP|nr:jg21225 [Pararge aegeria aegeria]